MVVLHIGQDTLNFSTMTKPCPRLHRDSIWYFCISVPSHIDYLLRNASVGKVELIVKLHVLMNVQLNVWLEQSTGL